MRKTIKQLEEQLRHAEDRVRDINDKWGTALVRARDAESKLAEVEKKAESDRWKVNGEQYQKGILEGYQQRVREEDAHKLGKMWHEAFYIDQFGNRVTR